MQLVINAPLNFSGGFGGLAEKPLRSGHIKVGFVDGGLLLYRSETVKNCHNFSADLRVQLVAAGNKNCIWAKALRLVAGHGGFHAEGLRLIARGKNDSGAVLRVAADNKGLFGIFRVRSLLAGSKK